MMEHDVVMEMKLEQLSEQMEEFMVDVCIAVLVRLKKRSDLVLDSVKEEDIPF